VSKIPNKGKKYNKTVKLIVEKGRSVPSLAQDLDLSEKTLYVWMLPTRYQSTGCG
jgi:transposase